MAYLFPFGQELHPLVQQDQTPKSVFVLGVYASAVHARWKKGNTVISQALAVASEPRIFWDGNMDDAWEIIRKCNIPEEVGYLEPASAQLNGPSAKILDEDILAPLGFSRKEAWLCDMLPETRLNPNQIKVLREKYDPLVERYGLNEVTVPSRPNAFCNRKRCGEITDELLRSEASLLVLLGDLPIKQYLNEVSDAPFHSLQEFVDLYGYGNSAEVNIAEKRIKVLPLAHPRQIGALGSHSEKWHDLHRQWEKRKASEYENQKIRQDRIIMKYADVKLLPLEEADREQFIIDNQWAFKQSALIEFGVRDNHIDADGEIISRRTIEMCMVANNAETYRIVLDGQIVGGVILHIDKETQINELDTLFVLPDSHSKGVGYGAWVAIEKLHPETKAWKTCTPYFDKRNIHFYVNKCGFQIDEFWCEYFKPTEAIPDDIPEEGPDEMFHFVKVMK